MTRMDSPVWDEELSPSESVPRFSWLAGFFGLILVFGSVMLPLVPFYTSMTSNNARLSRFGDAVCNHPLPPETSMSACDREFGSLEGNGNHCDYLVRVQLTSELGDSDLYSFYRDVRFRSPSGLEAIEPVLYRDDPAAKRGAGKWVLEVSEIAAQDAGFDIRWH